MKSTSLSRRRFLALTGLGAGLVVSGCGAPGSADSQSETASTGQVDIATREIEYWDWNYEPRRILLERLTAEWQEQNPGVTLVRQALEYSDAQTKLLTAASAGTNPPFANVYNVWRFSMQRAGLLAPYPDDLLPFDQMISTPFNRDPETGRIYTSTFNHFTDQIYFNLAHLDEAGIAVEDVPTRWDDFIEFTKTLTQRDSGGVITRSGWSLNHYYSQQWIWQTLVYQQGAWLYNEAGDAATWNSDAGVQALQLIKDVFYAHAVDSIDSLNLFEAFGTQTASSYISQGYTGAGIDTEYPDMQGNWGTAPTPTFDGEPQPAWGLVVPEEGLCVFSNATPEDQEIAFSFIQFILGPDERALDWAIMQGGPPDRGDLLDHERLIAEDHNQMIATQAVTLPWRVNAGEQPLQAEKYWRTMFDRILLEDADPKAALDEATAGFNAELQAADEKPLITERQYQAPA